VKKIIIFSFFLFSWTANVRQPFLAGKIVWKVAPSEYRCATMYRDSTVYTYIYNGTNVTFAPYVIGGLKAIDVTPGFNRTVILDQNNYAWVEVPGDHFGACTRFDTDTTGAAFNDNASLYSYFSAYFSISLDSTKVYAFGNADSYKWIDNTGNRVFKPYLLWTAPSGKKIKKLACGTNFMILLTNGDVYERSSGDLTATYTKRTLPANAFCVDVAASQNNFVIYLLHDYAGGDSTQGYPYWTGSESGFVGDNNSRVEPFSLKSIWGLTIPWRVITCNTNTYHGLDSAWKLWGGGDGAQGEIGDSTEIVNSYTYLNYSARAYSWTTVKCQGGTCKIPKPIMRNINWTNARFPGIGNSFTFYQYICDQFDTAYVTGRSKSFVSNYITSNDESLYPNSLDRLWFQHYCPFSNPLGIYQNFFLPAVHLGGSKTVTAVSTTIGGLDTAAQMGAYGFTISNVLITQKSGPNTANIVSPTSASSTVSGLINGTYVFKKVMTDNNFGTWADSATITVNIATNNGVRLRKFRGFKQI
jgi:hypothetical protein